MGQWRKRASRQAGWVLMGEEDVKPSLAARMRQTKESVVRSRREEDTVDKVRMSLLVSSSKYVSKGMPSI